MGYDVCLKNGVIIIGILILSKWRYQIGMELVVYNEWQKKGYPLGPSSAAYDAGLNRRLSRRCSARVKAQRASYSPSSHLGMNGGAEDFFLRPPVGRGSRRHSRPEEERGNKFRDLATPTLLHFGNAQASLALRSTSAAPIMGEVRYNSLMKTFPQEAEELFVATERNAKLRYEGYKKLSEM